MSKPKVTVACITYNHEKYVTECLEGILMQKCSFEYELIIHDDCSTDNTQNILKQYQQKFPDRIRLILQTENQYSQGRKPLIDFVFPEARGQYIAFCEGDDYWMDASKLQRQVDFLEDNLDHFAAFHHRKVQLNGEGPIFEKIKRNDFLNDTSLEKGEIIHTSIPTLSLMMRNDIKELTQLDYTGVYGGDVLLRSFISTKGKVRYQHFYGGVYRKHSGGIFSSLKRINALNKAIETRTRILQILSEVDKGSIYSSMCKIYIHIIKEKVRKKDFSVFRDFLILAKYATKVYTS